MLTPSGGHGMNPKPTALFSGDFRVAFDGFRFCNNFKLEREAAAQLTNWKYGVSAYSRDRLIAK